jgi:hypothetical protein
VQSLVGAGGNLATYPETDYVHRIAAFRGPRRQRLGLARPDAPEAIERLNQLVPATASRPPVVPLMSRYLATFIRHLGRAADGGGWLEKTPRHLHYINLIRGAAPDAMFIHVVREPSRVVASMVEVTSREPGWGGPRSVQQCLDRWINDVVITRTAAADGEHHVVVSYEQLVADPAGTLARLFAALGPHADCFDVGRSLTGYRATAQLIRRDDENWKNDVGAEIADRGDGKARALLSTSDRRLIATAREAADPDSLPFV